MKKNTNLTCPKFDYNLTALTPSRCPECGETFIVTDLDGYVARNPPSKLMRVCRVLWAAGTVLIIMSWTGTVSSTTGWAGFGLALVGWLISMGLRR